MFRLTISQKLVPNEESFKEDPPLYELSLTNSAGMTPVHLLSPVETPLEEFPFPPMASDQQSIGSRFNQNLAELWDSTVLANVHKLDNLHQDGNALAKNLDVTVNLTQSLCKKGEPPVPMDPSNIEFRQGDYIHGYVTLQNKNQDPIPFDMVYVVFEGITCAGHTPAVLETPLPPAVLKFLNMFDLFASWSYANIHRLATDEGDPHDWCEGETDPYDNTLLSIDVKRLFQPGITYKRFFSFRIPDRLLDDCCDVHNLDTHCHLIPTLGDAYNPGLLKKTLTLDKTVRDLSFMDSCISYAVLARVIGRGSQYGIKSQQDRYCVVQEVAIPIRVLPDTILPVNADAEDTKASAYYDAFVKCVQQKITEGSLVAEGLRSRSSTPVALSPVTLTLSRVSLSLIQQKLRSLYTLPHSSKPFIKKAAIDRYYRHVLTCRKRTLTGYSRVIGSLTLSTPKTTLRMTYVPPLKYRPPDVEFSTRVQVPLEISFIAESDRKFPELREISCDLVAVTVKSRKHYIPVEFSSSMLFSEEVVEDMARKRDEVLFLEANVIRPFQEYYQKLVSLMKEIGFDNDEFRVETLLFKDIKSLAMLQTKSINLAVPGVSILSAGETWLGAFANVNQVPWVKSPDSRENYVLHSKSMTLDIDLNTCHLKGTPEVQEGLAFDRLSLVPNFQSCLMCRFYFVRIKLRLKGGMTQAIHVPLTIYS